MQTRDEHPRLKPSPPQRREPSPSDRHELASFRHDINLVAFAEAKGYRIDERASYRSSCVMRHSDGDKISIGKAQDGHWQYYSWRDAKDNGDIIQFVQNRAGGREVYPLGEVRKELRQWTHTIREVSPAAARPFHPAVLDREAVTAAVTSSAALDCHPYLESRGLARDTLASPRFRGTWLLEASGRRNVIFPHYDSAGLCGFEVKNNGFTGFAKGGVKGLWSSKVLPCDQRLVITESAIDAMSYHQVNPHPKTRYASIAGAQSRQQPALLDRAISWMPAGTVVVAATDNDAAGQTYAKGIADLCSKHPHVRFERHAPTLGKDWNDHLQTLRRQHHALGREHGSRGLQR